MTSQEYWAKREAEQLQHNLTEEAEIQKKVEAMYRRTYIEAQKDIASFYTRYAKSEGLTLAEARQKVTSLEIKDYEEKAKKYVRLKDFSEQANAEMKLYNATMRINRLEMLKAEIGLELCENTAELEELLGDTLNERTLAEFERQAGILGKTVHGNAKLAKSIVNASFQSGTFSERLWGNQVTLRTELESLLVSGLVQGKNPRALAPQLEKIFDVSKNAAERLMRTELARVQTDAQMESYKQAGYTQYMFITVGAAACQVCSKLNGEVFNVADMAPGTNAPPMHPNCRCSTAAYMDREKVWAEIEGGNGNTTTENSETQETKFQNNHKDGKIKTLPMDLQLFAEKDISKQESTSLKKGIRTYGKRISDHEGYIKNPITHVEEWNELPQNRKEGLIRHWQKEIKNFKQAIQDREDELKKRGDYDD